MTNADVFVIWSFEHDAWWAPERCYTRDLSEAERYSEIEASVICLQANRLRLNELMMRLHEAEMFVGVQP